MDSQVLASVVPMLHFLSYFGVSLILVGLFCLIYGLVTPYNELALIKQGKVAPAISYGGAVLGFSIPLASSIVHSASLVDMILWAIIAMVVQIAVFLLFRLVLSDIVRQIEKDQLSSGVALSLFSIAAGILNAASMS